MKAKPKLLVPVLLAASSLVVAGLVLAQEGAAIDWWVFGNASGPVSVGDGVTIDATLGQAVIGLSSADAVSLGAGYWYIGVEPTAVRLVSFEASPLAGGILVTWETATEVDNLGFDLYRRAEGQGELAKLNEFLIPSKSPGGMMGQEYDWFDGTVEPGMTYLYFLDDVDIYFQRTRHGPAVATALYSHYLPLALIHE